MKYCILTMHYILFHEFFLECAFKLWLGDSYKVYE